MKQELIEKIDEIEARNDATRCLLTDAVTSADESKVEAVTTAIHVQRRQGRALDNAWTNYLREAAPNFSASERFPAQLKFIRDTAREIASLISAVLDGHDEAAQFTNSALTIANQQAAYIRELRDIVGEL